MFNILFITQSNREGKTIAKNYHPIHSPFIAKRHKPKICQANRQRGGGSIRTNTKHDGMKLLSYLNGPLGSRRGTSRASRASKRHGPFHHEQTLLSTLVIIFEPMSPEIGRNWTSASWNNPNNNEWEQSHTNWCQCPRKHELIILKQSN